MLGWLHVTPEGEKQSRMQSESWPLPDCGDFAYIVSWFCQLRLSFDYQDIDSWVRLTGSQPNPIEIDLLMSMSNMYSNSLVKYRAKEHNLIPPYDGRTQEEISSMINDKMKRSLERFKNAN